MAADYQRLSIARYHWRSRAFMSHRHGHLLTAAGGREDGPPDFETHEAADGELQDAFGTNPKKETASDGNGTAAADF